MGTVRELISKGFVPVCSIGKNKWNKLGLYEQIDFVDENVGSKISESERKCVEITLLEGKRRVVFLTR